ncbi:hypothetical protein [Krasilnikovia sp. M28-CT-15]|uniref:hypothetical protein n=1 Tax=Krasilnikovia sp. M28-CT-15 TaxID=3373540 RepID=UPI0038763E02
MTVFDRVPRWMGSPWFWLPLSLFGFGALIVVDSRRVLVLSDLHGGVWAVSVVAGLGVAASGLFLAWHTYGRLRASVESGPSASPSVLRRLVAAAGTAYALTLLAAFAVTHPRRADDLGADTPFQVVTLTAVVVLAAAALAVIVTVGVRLLLGRSGRGHRPRGAGRKGR